MAAPVTSLPAKAPYPEDADRKIRAAARLVFYDAPVQTLDLIKTQLFGSADRAEWKAQDWATSTVMSASRKEIQGAKDNLAAYWEGGAFNAFNSYASSVVGILDGNQSTMGNMSSVLGNCIVTVYQTYASAISLIGKCFADLCNVGGWVAIALATEEIPVVDVLTDAAALNKLIDALTSFVKNVTDLLSSATGQIGQYRAQGLSFQRYGSEFKIPESPGTAVGDVGGWHVHPYA
jgi:hypothetical protein